MIYIVSKQDGSDVVEEDEMKSNHRSYSTQSNYYYLFLHALSIQIKKTKNSLST